MGRFDRNIKNELSYIGETLACFIRGNTEGSPFFLEAGTRRDYTLSILNFF